MKLLLAVSLLAAVATAETDKQFSEEALRRLYIHVARIGNEKNSIQAKIDNLKQANKDLITSLDSSILKKLGDKDDTQAAQDERIEALSKKLKALSFTLAPAEASLEGNIVVAARLDKLANGFWSRLNELSTSNREQDGLTEKIKTALNASREAVDAKLELDTDKVIAQIKALYYETQDYADFLNTRHCYSDVVEVEMNTLTGPGEAYLPFPEDFFSGADVPDVLCALQGFDSSINVHQSNKAPSKGYYSAYDDNERQKLAVGSNCIAFRDKVLVQAFDQSEGERNAVTKAYVQVKACSLPAISGFPKH